MKFLMTFLLGVCLLFVSVPAMADQAEDEAAVRKVALQILDGYSAGTPDKMAELFAEDWENWEGTVKGRAAWKKYATEVLQRRKGVKFKQMEEIGIVFSEEIRAWDIGMPLVTSMKGLRAQQEKDRSSICE